MPVKDWKIESELIFFFWGGGLYKCLKGCNVVRKSGDCSVEFWRKGWPEHWGRGCFEKGYFESVIIGAVFLKRGVVGRLDLGRRRLVLLEWVVLEHFLRCLEHGMIGAKVN